ncbi:D-alanyl-D-alanine carboxypeptidase/D-alanyl-D-alanine-endopeptidase [Frigidibacter albus]|uniref:D-alanyl-D-alanine carboxypeptidase/D-alanyl-D-alanine-endopeptidase n=1 Tax=Frigidibacter albus TaxID=1465486 RepID=A0A6L8VIR4_9RHOB|nr:D-alanyl-D-alanine carboxypeptidase/D-alanyl-D-alanine-endopeptidase [Frigidibacter albus]MZQ89422.1 D-alanyl-D-alanine carboxypeptidase/D-alanyl-D-alanine-endopeptidase [Frigidibacter albus]NBE31328.1 D-alanyl-D-alanine carboxypeptidase/D-alanyl-D-alanine-endopeptidase [Frigidibacter albus]GGH54076.1 D-alanyl-D-alanine carboxypeptidase [Frigidibacter albus]
MTGFSRRFVLGGLLSGAASAALAEAPLTSLRPMPRAGGAVAVPSAPTATRTAASAEALVAAAQLGGKVGFVVADARTGLVLEAMNGAEPMPPASVSKAITALYALEHLGAGHRFATRLIATGPVQGGRLAGDLVLAGGGDPTLSTDTLGDMAAALRAAGISSVAGRFVVWGGALPFVRAIDTTQPDYLGYNPAVSGLNLNFNRVHFEWKRAQSGYQVSMDARAERFVPKVYTTRIAVADRDRPVYTYSDRGEVEEWTVARTALGKGGSRWLPVRRPELYAADVFQTLARAQGITLPTPQVAKSAPRGTVIVERASDTLRPVLHDMLRFSNNLTAEAVGMSASMQRGGVRGHAQSGPAMSDWLKARAGAGTARFVDHSGLGGASRISAMDMVTALARLGPGQALRGILKEFTLRDANGKVMQNHPVQVDAKTGTLNFVSTLAGWMTAPDGTDLVFAIFTGDVARRDAIPDAQKEQPPGAPEWVRRSKRLQQQLIERWAAVYGA